MHKVIPIIALLTGCAQSPDPLAAEKAEYRRQAFRECMAALPAGPVAAKYNDWDEVVAKCDTVSYYQMNTRFQ